MAFIKSPSNSMQSESSNLDRGPSKRLAWWCLDTCDGGSKLLQTHKVEVCQMLPVQVTMHIDVLTALLQQGKTYSPPFSLCFDRTSWCLHLNPTLLPEEPKRTSHTTRQRPACLQAPRARGGLPSRVTEPHSPPAVAMYLPALCLRRTVRRRGVRRQAPLGR